MYVDFSELLSYLCIIIIITIIVIVTRYDLVCRSSFIIMRALVFNYYSFAVLLTGFSYCFSRSRLANVVPSSGGSCLGVPECEHQTH